MDLWQQHPCPVIGRRRIIILPFFRYLGSKVSNHKIHTPASLILPHHMAGPSTPPNSQNVTFITLSDTTPLRRDLGGSEVHTSTPQKNASERYADITFDMCEQFVGPMPVEHFLKEFVRDAPTTRPQGSFAFAKSSVSQNENEFVRFLYFN